MRGGVTVGLDRIGGGFDGASGWEFLISLSVLGDVS